MPQSAAMGFRRAADELGVTAPAVSRTIARLEEHLGVLLFQRTSTGAVLTQEGTTLFEGISTSFGNIEQTLQRLKRTSPSGKHPIVLSVSSAFATHWFMPRLAAFQTEFPDVEARFQLISGPVEGSDIAMRFDFKGDTRHVSRPLMPEILLPISAPCYQERSATTGDLVAAAERIITLSSAPPDWSELFSNGPRSQRDTGLLFDDYTVVVQAALIGHGVALGWLNVVSQLLVRGGLIPASSKTFTMGRMFTLVTGKGRVSPHVTEICDWIKFEIEADMIAIHSQYPQLDLPG